MTSAAVCVKNTFVHIDLPSDELAHKAGGRRASSVPRSSRLCGGAGRSVAEAKQRAGSDFDGTASVERSTEADITDCESIGSCAWGSPLPRRQAWADAEDDDTVWLPAAAEPKPERQRLNPKAKAWTPGGPMGAAIGPSLTPEATSEQLSTIVAASVDTLRRASAADVAVEGSEGPMGWSVIVNLKAANFEWQCGEAMEAARQSIAAAVQAAPGVHVLGVGPEPFGCSIAVGFFDEATVCWDSLTLGFCPRGCACRWQHSASRATVSVVIQAGA
mmetsp:Transcript_100894/g.290072  ORF Transcript_100894/g.290072 Transcript_100894/m.290072 type:complete len:274 (-) Transcript_100894:57-878(-)|eukprot:CAMPEP_0170254750 /NCGR_PEP_ID=MMETSP0116_2-20130129/27226_1 /TAXON_ID=400756 /ORGANISM="Durinskia baltica, Strain CSIRO CS-38" /LENGTH=273 /DNA_ID=CAMNT_0010505755 /DNA_START=118 /DNA_END=939 /DNA_ORIENTATION=+